MKTPPNCYTISKSDPSREKAVEWIAHSAFDPTFGARPIKRAIQRNVLNELSKQILSELVKQNQTIEIQ